MRAAIYARISSDPDDRRAGVDRQTRDGRDLIEDEGWELIGTYVDNDMSGFTGRERPEYERLCADIREGKVDAVVVMEVSRLARNKAEQTAFSELCERSSLQYVIAGTGTKWNVKTGDGLDEMEQEELNARKESRRISRRTRRAMRDIAEQGGWHGGGTRTFGYAADHSIVPAEAEAIKSAARAVIAGRSLASIARDWTSGPNAIPTVTGVKEWNPVVVKRLLANPTINGKRVHAEQIGRKNGKPVYGEPVSYPGTWAPILDDATFLSVRKAFEETRPQVKGGTARRSFPLRGILVCGECGHFLVSSGNNYSGGRPGKYRTYACACKPGRGGQSAGCHCAKVGIHADNVEAAIFETILRYADNPNLRGMVAEDDHETTETLVALLEADREDNAELDQWAEDQANGLCTRSQRMRACAVINARIAERESILSELRGSTVLATLGEDVSGRWDGMSDEDKRMIVKALCDKIVIAPCPRSGKGVNPRVPIADRITRIEWTTAKIAAMSKADADVYEHRLRIPA